MADNPQVLTEKLVKKSVAQVEKMHAEGKTEIPLNNPVFDAERKKQKQEIAAQEKPPKSEKPKAKETIGGYNPVDILKAPLETPKLEEVESENEVKHPVTQFLLLVSSVIALLGLITFVWINADLGLSLALVGAIGIAISVFWNPPKSRS